MKLQKIKLTNTEYLQLKNCGKLQTYKIATSLISGTEFSNLSAIGNQILLVYSMMIDLSGLFFHTVALIRPSLYILFGLQLIQL